MEGSKKRVTFGSVKVRYLIVWKFAYAEARKGIWQMVALDSERFRIQIQNAENILRPVLEHKIILSVPRNLSVPVFCK